jgi:cellulose biosynthesis protein BcsQ
MSVPVIAFFNNKGGVGKTSLVYHLSWMFAEMGLYVIAGDLDPQSNLTSAFIDEERLEEVFSGDDHSLTLFGALRPLIAGTGDVACPHAEQISDKLGLVIGDMALSSFEDQLSEVWPKCLDRDERSFRVVSSFWRIMQKAAEEYGADVILVDLGPNLGAINRAALISSDYVVIPLGPDLFSLQGLRNLGPTLRRWREGWEERLERNPVPKELALPRGSIKPIGYIILRHSIRLDRPVKAYERWMARIPLTYRREVLDQSSHRNIDVEDDQYCIARLKDYRSLMPLSQEARKPMFFLQPADGAIGAHSQAAKECYKHFRNVAVKICKRTGLIV